MTARRHGMCCMIPPERRNRVWIGLGWAGLGWMSESRVSPSFSFYSGPNKVREGRGGSLLLAGSTYLYAVCRTWWSARHSQPASLLGTAGWLVQYIDFFLFFFDRRCSTTTTTFSSSCFSHLLGLLRPSVACYLLPVRHPPRYNT
ncbi:hypothetical protein JOL62DRAFT_20120 [Phyllosticta paracitricarpa]|uniref:Uncharacterized protein n=1 Tax=Phyllosticta paracitricarpa TaxID=2016321 RepID=A0ABR1NAT1_9PEZI